MESSILNTDLVKEAIPSLIKAAEEPEGQCPFKTAKLVKIIANRITKRNLLQGICDILETQEASTLTNPTIIFTYILAQSKHKHEIIKAITEAIEEIDERLTKNRPPRWMYNINFDALELLDRYAENIIKSMVKINTHYYCMKATLDPIYIGKITISQNPKLERLKLLCNTCCLLLNWKIINWKLVESFHAIVFRKRYNKCLNCKKTIVKFCDINNCVKCVESFKRNKREVFRRGYINLH